MRLLFIFFQNGIIMICNRSQCTDNTNNNQVNGFFLPLHLLPSSSFEPNLLTEIPKFLFCITLKYEPTDRIAPGDESIMSLIFCVTSSWQHKNSWLRMRFVAYFWLALFGLHIINLNSCAIFHFFSLVSMLWCVARMWASNDAHKQFNNRGSSPQLCLLFFDIVLVTILFAKWTKRNQIRHNSTLWVPTYSTLLRWRKIVTCRCVNVCHGTVWLMLDFCLAKISYLLGLKKKTQTKPKFNQN